jgi:hypothetical protein
MDAPVLSLPVSYVQAVNEASAGLIDVAKHLESLAQSLPDPKLRDQLEIEISRLLDFTDRLSSATRFSLAS